MLETDVKLRSGNKSATKPKDRPKSNSQTNLGGKKGSRGEDQPSSSSASLSHNPLESVDCPRRIIADDEIYALRITEESLQMLREPPKPRTPLPAQSVIVQKEKPSPYPPNACLRRVTVAQPVPDDSQLHPRDYSAVSGARMDDYGNIIPHSILGDLDEFIYTAKTHRDLPPDYEQSYPPPRSDSQLSVRYENKKNERDMYTRRFYGGTQEDKALENWNRRMAERRCQQSYLSYILNKPPEALAMNQGDGLRKVNELRNLIDRAMPYVDYGKGYRAGSEFWCQQPNMGGEECGLFGTLTRSDKGCPPPIEHSGAPRCTLYEKGLRFESNSGSGTQTIHKPWHQSTYLRQRVVRLAPLMDLIDPFVPETSELQVVGQPIVICPSCGQAKVKSCECQDFTEEISTELGNSEEISAAGLGNTDRSCDSTAEDLPRPSDSSTKDLLKDQADSAQRVSGPSIVFAGHTLTWSGPASSYHEVAAVETRLGFEAEPCELKSACIEATNNGTTAIYYSWKMLNKPNPFGTSEDRIQRFYFDPVGGVILPGDAAKFTFLYRSPTPGIYTEQWQLMTHPVLCAGAPVVVTLRGVSVGRDQYSEERLVIEQLFASREADQIARSVLAQILERVHPAPRPRSPPNAYLTEEEMFNQRNPKLEYMEECCSRLRQLHMETVPEELSDSLVWDLRPTSIHQAVMIHCTDETLRDDFLERLNDAVLSVSFTRIRPQQQLLYNICYQFFGATIDKMFDESERLKHQLTAALTLTDDSKQKDDHALAASGSAGSIAEEKLSNSQSQEGSTSSGKQRKGKKESMKRASDSRVSKSTGKGSKAAAPAASDTTDRSPPVANATLAQPNAAAELSVMNDHTRAKYLDRFSAQVYGLLCEMAEDIEDSFADVLDIRPDNWPQCEEEFCNCVD